AAMAYDAATRTVILFGGLAFRGSFGQSALDDTWSWNGSHWTELNPASSPPGLAAALMGYDPATHQLVLTGGYETSAQGSVYPVQATWTWNGSTWSPQLAGELPNYTGGAALATDDATGQLILVTADAGCLGFETWRWTGSSWAAITTAVSPVPGGAPGLGYDPAIGKLVLVVDASVCPAGPGAPLATPEAGSGAGGGSGNSPSWSWDGSNWTAESSSPTPASGTVLAWSDGPLLVTSGQVYRWAGGDWSKAGPGPGVDDAAVAWDQADGKVVLFSGICGSCGGGLAGATLTWPSTASDAWTVAAGVRG
ncbi:MAG: hypothetical protein WCB85_08390, partial [Candidatus Dormiibacterota bacterium]